MNAKDLKEKPDSGQKRKLGWLEYIVAIGYPLPVAFVLFCVFDIIYLGLESVFGLVYGFRSITTQDFNSKSSLHFGA